MARRARPTRRSAEWYGAGGGDAGTGVLGIGGALLLGLFMASLFIPVEFEVAGLRLTPYTALLLVFIGPMFLVFLRDRGNRIVALDLLMLAHILWMSAAILYVHGPSRIVFVASQTVTLLGGYMVGRVLIRRSTDYELFFRYFFYGLLFFLPFALIELVTKQMILSEILGKVADVYPRAGQDQRLGLNRVQGFLEHSIGFGLFCSIGIANLFYIYRDSLAKRLTRAGLAAFMTFISLSSAPNIAQGLQFLLIVWDRTLARVRYKWVMLIIAAAVVLSILQLASENGLAGLVIENLAFDPTTGWGRTEILEYGGAEVLRHPVFGIGLNDWIRPWWKKSSVDNFWLLTAMRYGLPALFFLWAALAIHAARIMSKRGLSEEVASYRTGYLVAWVGVVFILGTVHIWGAVAVFVMAYIGAGAWFYTGPRTVAPPSPYKRVREIEREATVARAAGPGTSRPDYAGPAPRPASHPPRHACPTDARRARRS